MEMCYCVNIFVLPFDFFSSYLKVLKAYREIEKKNGLSSFFMLYGNKMDES